MLPECRLIRTPIIRSRHVRQFESGIGGLPHMLPRCISLIDFRNGCLGFRADTVSALEMSRQDVTPLNRSRHVRQPLLAVHHGFLWDTGYRTVEALYAQ